MPNWKSYESSVRLLSAIIAAHPQLKLNYDDVGRFYGDGATYMSIWHRMKIIIKNAEAIAAAVEAGLDPFQVPLVDSGQAVKSKTPDLSTRFGGDCTKSAIENRFRRIKIDAKLINDAVKKGVDPITLPIGLDQVNSRSDIVPSFSSDASTIAISHVVNRQVRLAIKMIKDCLAKASDPKEIAAFHGSDTTPGAIRGACDRHVIPILKKLKACMASGGDPKDLAVDQLWLYGKNEMVKYFGSDVTPNALGIAVRRHFNPMAKRMKEFAESGHDCKDLKLIEDPKISGKDLARHFGSDTTAGALQKHYSRYYKDNVKAIRECVQAGRDPKGLTLNLEASDAKSGKEILKHFDSTMKFDTLRIGIQRNVTPYVKLVKDCAQLGRNPMDLDLVVDAKDTSGTSDKQSKVEVAACFGSDASVSALRWQLAVPVKNNTKAIFDARAKGIDVKDITLPTFAQKGGKGQMLYFKSRGKLLSLCLSPPRAYIDLTGPDMAA
ncbi:hypothetical protein BUE80_DR005982 [Diplocarpon rosae]|nr:hypothetical protein BUE80_DR005982 [Diplocarpon rosae]